MKIVSFNVRGLRDSDKCRKVKKTLVQAAAPDAIFIQKSKSEVVDSFLVKSIWETRSGLAFPLVVLRRGLLLFGMLEWLLVGVDRR